MPLPWPLGNDAVTVLPVTTLLLSVKVPELMMPPPSELLFNPPVIVSPEIFTVAPELMEKPGDELLPLTLKCEAPGPLIVWFRTMVSTPRVLLSVMVLG